jgi:Zn-dependent protease/tetratricopeptide (TPR) repeat protein
MDILKLLLWLVAIILILKWIRILTAWYRMMGTSFAKAVARRIEPQDIPAHLVPMFDEAEATLLPLGFEFSHCEAHTSMFTAPDFERYSRVYYHAEQRTYATVSDADLPEWSGPWMIDLLTYMGDGTTFCTVDGRIHGFYKVPAWFKLEDSNTHDFQEQWAYHQRRLSETDQNPIAIPLDGYFEHQRQFHEEIYEQWAQSGRPGPDGRFRFRPQPAYTFTRQLLSGMQKRQIRIVQKKLPPLSSDSAFIGANMAAYDRNEAERRSVRHDRGLKACAFLVSMALFCIVFGLMLGWNILPLLVGVLLIHELGHVVGMKVCGYKDPQILFVPFLGAMAAGTKDNPSTSQRLLVLLLGPMPGIILGFAMLFVIWRTGDESWQFAAAFAIVLNYINLLPMTPLDGGRVIETLFLKRFPMGQFSFLLVSTMLFILGAVAFRDPVLIFVSIILLMSLRAKFIWGKAARYVEARLPPEADHHRQLYWIFTALSDPAIRSKPYVNRYQLARGLHDHLKGAPASAAAMAIGTAIYLFCLVAPILLPVSFLIWDRATRDAMLDLAWEDTDWNVELAGAHTPEEYWDILIQASLALRFYDEKTAGDYLARAVEIARSKRQDSNRYTRTLSLYSTAAEDTGELVTMLQAELEAVQQDLGGDHPSAAYLHWLLGGNFPAGTLPAGERVTHLEQAALLLPRLSPGELAEFVPIESIFTSLAQAYQSEGRTADAEKAYIKCLGIVESGTGEESVPVNVYSDLADFYFRLSRIEEAEQTLRDGIAACEALETMQYSVAFLEGQAGWYRLQNSEPQPALEWFQRAASRYDHTSLEESLDICAALQQLGREEEVSEIADSLSLLAGERGYASAGGMLEDYFSSEEFDDIMPGDLWYENRDAARVARAKSLFENR